MNSLVKELIQPLLEEANNSIALYPGKFKPPHKGHFEVAKQLLDKANKVEILISDKEVDNITAEKSKEIWDVYNKLLGGKLDIKIISGSPVKYVLDTIKENPNTHYIAVYGKGEQDRYRNIGVDPRYKNAEIFDGGTITSEDKNINATDFRNALLSGKDISKFLPDGINKQDIFNALGIDSVNEQCGCQHSLPTNLKDAMISLTTYMIENDMNILPLPALKLIDNDVENANNILGKTAYYNPNDCSITLFTLNRHPKDILRSYAHEMIHRIQDNEGRLHNTNTTNTNEDGKLEELEKEAYLKGNITFRNWEDNLKNNINEWVVDIPKYNYTPNLSNKLFSQLHELKVNEIALNPNNAVEIYGDLDNGDFTVGEYDYNYRIIKLDKNPYNSDSFYNIDFHEIGNKNPNPSLPTKNARENYIKILSTIYKIILDFTKEKKPEYIGISSLDESGYWNIYNNLTKTNKLPGYSRKDAGLQFKDKNGKTGKFIVLKRTDV